MQKTILSICITLILISIFFTLIPNKNIEPTIKFTLNLFLISVIIIPIINFFKNFKFSEYSEFLKKNELNKEDLEKKIFKTNKENLEKALKIVFLKNGYKDLDISININKEKKTTNITVKIPENKNYNTKKIEQIVKQQTGIIPKIEFF